MGSRKTFVWILLCLCAITPILGASTAASKQNSNQASNGLAPKSNKSLRNLIPESVPKSRVAIEFIIELGTLCRQDAVKTFFERRTINWYDLIPEKYQNAATQKHTNLWSIILFIRNLALHKNQYGNVTWEEIYNIIALIDSNSSSNGLPLMDRIAAEASNHSYLSSSLKTFEKRYYQNTPFIPYDQRTSNELKFLRMRAFGLMIMEVFSISSKKFENKLRSIPTRSNWIALTKSEGENIDHIKENAHSMAHFVRNRYAHAGNYENESFAKIYSSTIGQFSNKEIDLFEALKTTATQSNDLKVKKVLEDFETYMEQINTPGKPSPSPAPTKSNAASSSQSPVCLSTTSNQKPSAAPNLSFSSPTQVATPASTKPCLKASSAPFTPSWMIFITPPQAYMMTSAFKTSNNIGGSAIPSIPALTPS